MSHTFEVSEDQYADIEAYAKSAHETPESLFQAWVQGMINRIGIRRAVLEEQTNMSHALQIPVEQYAKLAAYAKERNEAPEKVFQAWVQEVIDSKLH
jgi:hypothetical protein